MNAAIHIIEKPDWVSWDDIHQVLYASHEVNRKRGMYFATAELSGDKLRDAVGDGKCFVAIDGDKVVGTCSVKIKNLHRWFAKGPTAYYMYSGILPEYQGQGIYSLLEDARDRYVDENHIEVIYVYTSEGNFKQIKQKLSRGFQRAGVSASRNTQYYSILLVRWKTPPPSWYVQFRFQLSKCITLLRYNRKRFRPEID